MGLWSIARDLHIPLDEKISHIRDIPYSLSYVIKKRQQVDNFNELPRDKRPTDRMIWEDSPEELEDWLDRVFSKNNQPVSTFVINEDEIG